jgi:predicted transcriptional regulator
MFDLILRIKALKRALRVWIDVHRRVDWLKPADKPILLEFREYGKWMTPPTIYVNVEYADGYVRKRIKALDEHDFLERHPEKNAFRISNRGRQYLEADQQLLDVLDVDEEK